MKATELIEQLRAIIAEHGDIVVSPYREGCGWWLPDIGSAYLFPLATGLQVVSTTLVKFAGETRHAADPDGTCKVLVLTD